MIAQENTDRTRRIPRTARATQPVCSSNVSGLARSISARPEMMCPQKKFKNLTPNTVAHAYRRVKRFAKSGIFDGVQKGTTELPSMQRNGAPRPRVVLHQKKRKKEHQRAAHRQNPIRIYVRQGRRLGLH